MDRLADLYRQMEACTGMQEHLSVSYTAPRSGGYATGKVLTVLHGLWPCR